MRITERHLTMLDTQRREFEDTMIEFLYEHFPEECKELGSYVTRAEVRKGIDRAAVYNIVDEHDVCMYIELMFILGENFDIDLKYPWAEEILSEDTWDPSDKIERVYDECERRQNESDGTSSAT
jgi:hypothetical protein